MDGPDGDLEVAGEFCRGQAAARLEDEQEVDQATGSHHERIRPSMTERVM
jgi:hypothetical protein